MSEGLGYDHAYTVLEVRENVEGSGCNIVQLRNPHGRTSTCWNGAWSNDWDGWLQIPDLKVRLGVDDYRDEGIFWMCEDDFFSRCGDIWIGLPNKG